MTSIPNGWQNGTAMGRRAGQALNARRRSSTTDLDAGVLIYPCNALT
jgi:hypothetical protein